MGNKKPKKAQKFYIWSVTTLGVNRKSETKNILTKKKTGKELIKNIDLDGVVDIHIIFKDESEYMEDDE